MWVGLDEDEDATDEDLTDLLRPKLAQFTQSLGISMFAKYLTHCICVCSAGGGGGASKLATVLPLRLTATR